MAVRGVDWIGVDRSIAVTYTFESVLKAVGDFGSVCGPKVLLVLTRGVAAVWI